jgi:GNAT superfamily N-acetyltransferase
MISITNNLYQLYEFIGTQNGCVLNKGKNADWVITKPSCWPNMIYNTRNSAEGIYDEIKEIIGYIRKKEAPPFWIITPETDRAVESVLESLGMMAIDLLTGMATDLRAFSFKYDGKNTGETLNLKEVSSPGQLPDWLHIVNKVIFKGKTLSQELFTRIIGNPSIHFYTGYIGKVPAATSMSFLNPPSAGFYNIATLPEFRKKGFGTAMTAYAMIEAVNKGCTTGILHASMMGEPVYHKMGYEPYGEYKIFWMAGKEYRDY